MAARLKLYVNWSEKKLMIGPKNNGTFQLPSLYQGDVVPIEVHIFEPDPDGGPNDFIKQDVSSMALKLGIGPAPTGTAGGPSLYVTQFTWSKNTDENYFYADVAMNTAELTTAIGSSASLSAYMELEVTEGSGVTTIWQGAVTIKAELIEASTATVAAGETPLSLDVALQMFAQKIMPAGETFTLVSSDGTRRIVLYCHDDGSFHSDAL